ncbi:MAG TPA: carbon-nitrogen hydrolase family protein [Thermomicrobiales bacterium]|nr:carbon-nitrogen hydrolase family protein [Thermomicrobiales bacterium]
MDTMRVALVQINSRHDKEANIRRAEELIDQAAATGARLVALPEYVNFLGPREQHEEIAETIPGPITERFSAKAKEHGIYLLGGSIHERTGTPGKFYNTSVLYGPDGEMLARYRKIHLFDIDLTGNVSANESATILPGEEIVTAEVDGHTVGLSICYDLRFPELYRLLALEGAEILFVPAAFTMFTGKDHWHTLLRARAIENQAFVLAPGQFGAHEPNDQRCYGHSLIVDPWGTVLADAPDKECVVTAELDFEHLRKIRTQLPSLANRRPSAYLSREAVVAD